MKVKCINAQGYDASLTENRTYDVIAHRQIDTYVLLQLVDDTGGDYFFPDFLFEEVKEASVN